MRNLSLGRRHLVNAYEVKAGIGVIAGNTVWSMPQRLECEVLQKARYINTLTFTFTRSDLVIANVILPANAEYLPLTLHEEGRYVGISKNWCHCPCAPWNVDLEAADPVRDCQVWLKFVGSSWDILPEGNFVTYIGLVWPLISRLPKLIISCRPHGPLMQLARNWFIHWHSATESQLLVESRCQLSTVIGNSMLSESLILYYG